MTEEPSDDTERPDDDAGRADAVARHGDGGRPRAGEEELFAALDRTRADLAAAPLPPLPADFAARMAAALDAERARGAATAGPPPSQTRPTPPTADRRRRRPGPPRRSPSRPRRPAPVPRRDRPRGRPAPGRTGPAARGDRRGGVAPWPTASWRWPRSPW